MLSPQDQEILDAARRLTEIVAALDVAHDALDATVARIRALRPGVSTPAGLSKAIELDAYRVSRLLDERDFVLAVLSERGVTLDEEVPVRVLSTEDLATKGSTP